MEGILEETPEPLSHFRVRHRLRIVQLQHAEEQDHPQRYRGGDDGGEATEGCGFHDGLRECEQIYRPTCGSVNDEVVRFLRLTNFGCRYV